jgi:hypothetical protein
VNQLIAKVKLTDRRRKDRGLNTQNEDFISSAGCIQASPFKVFLCNRRFANMNCLA